MPLIEPSDYSCPALLIGPDMQTIYPRIFRKIWKPPYQRQRLNTDDGDFIDVDWIKSGSNSLAILLHGLEGSANSWYIRAMTAAFNSKGIDVAALNFRGCSGELNLASRSYHSGATDDLEFVVRQISKPYKRLFSVGYSLGGNVLLKYLGETGDSCPIDSAVAFSVPCDLLGSSIELAKRRNRFYMQRFLIELREKTKAKAKLFPDQYNLDGLSSIRTFYEFDDCFTAPIHGFDGAEDYYAKCSSLRFLDSIKKPTLLVNAENDPFLSPSCFPAEQANRSEQFWLEVPLKGGHNGFPGRTNEGKSWAEERAIHFILKNTEN